jgi:hypothetical protein
VMERPSLEALLRQRRLMVEDNPDVTEELLR